MNWLLSHWLACRLALTRLLRVPLNTLLTILGIGIALALPFAGQLVLSQFTQLSRELSATPQISLFMYRAAPLQAAQQLTDSLQARPEIAAAELIRSEDTYQRMQQNANYAEALEALGENPFPNAIVVTPKEGSPAAMEQLLGELKQLNQVEHVQIDAEWVRRLDALVRLGHKLVMVLAALLGVGLVSITFNIIRLQVLMRQAEIEVSRLLGATDAFICRPFLWHGGVLGLLGGITALLIVLLAFFWLRAPLLELTQLYQIDLQLLAPSLGLSGALLATGSFLGWLGALLSMRQHLG